MGCLGILGYGIFRNLVMGYLGIFGYWISKNIKISNISRNHRNFEEFILNIQEF